MESQDILTIVSNIIQILVTAAVSVAGSWFLFKTKSKEIGGTVEVAKINNMDDMVAAYGGLQSQLAAAASNMVAPLNEQIGRLQNQLDMAHEELKQLRDFVKQKSGEQEKLTKRVSVLEEENAFLRGELHKAEDEATRLREKLTRIRKDIDTGELPSGTHKLP